MYQVAELTEKWERAHRGQQQAELAAAQQAAALRQLELRLAQLSNEKEVGVQWFAVLPKACLRRPELNL